MRKLRFFHSGAGIGLPAVRAGIAAFFFAFMLLAFMSPAVHAGDIRLRVEEQKGGHAIERHVGKTDDQLIERMKTNQRISAASAFATLEDAETCVNTIAVQQKRRIDRWLSSAGRGERQAFKGVGQGKGISRKDFNLAMQSANPVEALKAAVSPRRRCRMVLQADGKGGFLVLTAYPE